MIGIRFVAAYRAAMKLANTINSATRVRPGDELSSTETSISSPCTRTFASRRWIRIAPAVRRRSRSNLAATANRVVQMRDGEIVADKRQKPAPFKGAEV